MSTSSEAIRNYVKYCEGIKKKPRISHRAKGNKSCMKKLAAIAEIQVPILEEMHKFKSVFDNVKYYRAQFKEGMLDDVYTCF